MAWLFFSSRHARSVVMSIFHCYVNWRASEASETLSDLFNRESRYMFLLHTSPAHCTFFNDA